MKGWDSIFKELEGRQKDSVEQQKCKIHEVINGEYIPGESGDVFYSEASFELGSKFGDYTVEIPMIAEVILLKEKIPRDIPINKYLFIDTESTGLNTGGGSYAILLGAGCFQGDRFVVKRWFLPDPASELTMLMEIKLLFDEYDLIISYNRKSYDMNLLQSRYDYHGINYRIKEKHQLDLLHLVRRFWKGKLSDCSLQTIERDILHYERDVDDEIPGWKIPWAYFNYLETGNPDDIVKIHEHNTIDILSMPVVMDYLCRIMANPDESDEHLLPCSRYYEHAGMRDKAVDLLESYTSTETNEKESLRLANLYKRNNDYAEAVSIWKKLACQNNLTALEELAKYEEHRNRNNSLAMEYTNKALDYLHSLPFNDLLPLRSWQKRKNRLANKLDKS
jgi:uncharacterized protein YprB with RNaseH-like and TPR domain